MLTCEYCNTQFKKESSLAAHMCRLKKRYLQRDEKHVKLGLKFFNDWYHLALGATGQKDYAQFAKSQYYAAFVRFGMYVLETRVLAPERYLHWLVKEKTRVDDWCKDSVYTRYLAEESKRETAERALERFVLHCERWSERTGHHWTAYWFEAKPFVIVNDIKMGKVSPWIFLGYSEAKQRLDDLPVELLSDIADTIDLPFWKHRINTSGSVVKWIEEIFKLSQ